jgi:hypothetical protein
VQRLPWHEQGQRLEGQNGGRADNGDGRVPTFGPEREPDDSESSRPRGLHRECEVALRQSAPRGENVPPAA